MVIMRPPISTLCHTVNTDCGTKKVANNMSRSIILKIIISTTGKRFVLENIHVCTCMNVHGCVRAYVMFVCACVRACFATPLFGVSENMTPVCVSRRTSRPIVGVLKNKTYLKAALHSTNVSIGTLL